MPHSASPCHPWCSHGALVLESDQAATADLPPAMTSLSGPSLYKKPCWWPQTPRLYVQGKYPRLRGPLCPWGCLHIVSPTVYARGPSQMSWGHWLEFQAFVLMVDNP